MAQVILKRSSRRFLTNYLAPFGIAAILLMILVKAYYLSSHASRRTPIIEQLAVPSEDYSARFGWLVKLTPELEKRVKKAASLTHEGRNKRYLSEALIDLLGFPSRCHRDVLTDDQPVVAIAIVHSAPENRELRDIIRRTWASPEQRRKHGILVRFVMGKPALPAHVGDLREESKKHGDILVGNFSESTRASTAKSLLALRWVLTFCSPSNFVIQAADDTFIWFDKLPKLIRTFQEDGNSQSVVGYRTNSSKVIHDVGSLYMLQEGLLNREFYPPYCSIYASFIMPFRLARQLFEKYIWTTTTLVPFADALVGLAAEEFKWKVRHSRAFTLFRIEERYHGACVLSTRFTALAPKEIQSIPSVWKQLGDPDFMMKCDPPDVDIIYKGIEADNVDYFREVLKPVIEDPRSTCNFSENVFMVVLVSSNPRRSDARKVIRETWASKVVLDSLKVKVKVFFLIGRPDLLAPKLRRSLDQELQEHGDLLEGNFMDDYKNLTLKHLYGLTWTAKNCNHARYFFKSDDDVFANLANIIDHLMQLNGRREGLKRLYLGNGGIEDRTSFPDNHYYVSSDEFRGKIFPEYCVGGGYVLSMDLVILALQEALQTPLITSRDDVYVGVLMAKLDVQMVYHTGFLYEKGKTDKCSLRDKHFMVVHVHGNAADLKKVWKNFVDSDVKCEHEKRESEL